jgi:hypothetical protein
MSTDYTAMGLKLDDVVQAAPALGLTVERGGEVGAYIHHPESNNYVYSEAFDLSDGRSGIYFHRSMGNLAAPILGPISRHFGVEIVSEYEEQRRALARLDEEERAKRSGRRGEKAPIPKPSSMT